MLLKIKQSGLVPLIGLDWKDDDSDALSWLQSRGRPVRDHCRGSHGPGGDHVGRVRGAGDLPRQPARHRGATSTSAPITEQAWTREILPRLPMGQTPAAAAKS